MIDHHVRTIERAADDRNVLGVVGFTATRRGPREDRPRDRPRGVSGDARHRRDGAVGPGHADLTEEMLRTGRFEVYVYEGTVSIR
jgi:hypothetical protein